MATVLILVDNAQVHTPAGTPITIAGRADDGLARLSVHDAGPGSAPEALLHILELFCPGDRARSGTSTGLGLSIARELVKGQGGTIAVESEPGRGSAFTVTLPLAGAGSQGALQRLRAAGAPHLPGGVHPNGRHRLFDRSRHLC